MARSFQSIGVARVAPEVCVERPRNVQHFLDVIDIDLRKAFR